MGWVVRIGQEDDAAGIRTQARVIDVITREEFAHVDFAVTVNKPTDAERQQDTGRIDSAVIEITRGSEDLIVGYIEGVERGVDYVKYTGRSFIVLLGYSTSGETDSSGNTKAEYKRKTGDQISTDLIEEFCKPKDSELVYSDITFTEEFGGTVSLHGKKVYQIIHDMCSMHGRDMWSTATWTGNNVTAKNIHIGTKSRGSSVSPNTTLIGGVHIANIPVIKYRTDADMVNAIRVLGKGTGKDRITAYYTDSTSIGNYGTIEAEPFYSNMIADVDTALAVGQAIVDAKKEPVAQLMVEPAYYINDLLYGDWVRIIDSYSGIDVTKRIKKITRSYNNDSGESMEIELGEKFNNYENIVRELTKGDVDPEPEMAKQSGSLIVTANQPPSDYVRIDKGIWYDTTGALKIYSGGVRPFWTYADNPAIGAYKKAVIQISDAGSVTYKVGTEYTDKNDAEDEAMSPDALNTMIGWVILKGLSGSVGAYVVDNVYNEDSTPVLTTSPHSYIYVDARPIIGSSSAGYGGESLWEVDGTETQLVAPQDLDLQNKGIYFNKGVSNTRIYPSGDNIIINPTSTASSIGLGGILSALYGIVNCDGITMYDSGSVLDMNYGSIIDSDDITLYDGGSLSPKLSLKVPVVESAGGAYLVANDNTFWINGIDDSVLATCAIDTAKWDFSGDVAITGDIDLSTSNITGVTYIKPFYSTGLDIKDSAAADKIRLASTSYALVALADVDMSNHDILNTKVIKAYSTNNLSFWDNANGTKTLTDLVSGGLWEVDGTETQLITADDIDMQGFNIIGIGDMRAHGATGIDVDNSAGTTRIYLGLTSYAFQANAPGNMNGNNLVMGSGDITGIDEIKGTSTTSCHLDFRGDDAHRIWYTGSSDNKVQYKTFLSHEFVIQTTDVLEVKTTGIHMKAGKYLKSDSGDLELRAPSGSKIKFVIG